MVKRVTDANLNGEQWEGKKVSELHVRLILVTDTTTGHTKIFLRRAGGMSARLRAAFNDKRVTIAFAYLQCVVNEEEEAERYRNRLIMSNWKPERTLGIKRRQCLLCDGMGKARGRRCEDCLGRGWMPVVER